MSDSPPSQARQDASEMWRAMKRHFLTLTASWSEPGGDVIHPFAASGFLLEIRNEWFFITAGHVIQYIHAALARGIRFSHWFVLDDVRGKGFENTGVPMPFSVDDWMHVHEKGADYAALHISGNPRQLLEKGNTKPVGESLCVPHDTPADHRYLVGLPAESLSQGAAGIAGRLLAVQLEPTDPPSHAERTPFPRLFLRLHDGSESVVNNVEGMSGGPIFAIGRLEGSLAYGLIGVQSAWHRPERVVIGCPSVYLANVLRDMIDEQLDGNGEDRHKPAKEA